MSSILKALRKLEEEKVRSGENRVDIAADILRGEGRSKGSGSRPAIWTTVLLAVLVLLAGGIYYLGAKKGPQFVVQPPAGEAVPGQSAGKAVTAVPRPPLGETPGPEPSTSSALSASGGGRQASGLAAGKPQASRPVKTEADAVPLTVSGIVYQDAPENRMAIINDLPVMTGSVVEGYRVEKILRDRVIFSDGERRLSVSLTEPE
ncbi:general secretion pathway protein B [Geothermobacter ehrlichii]|uniref:General secretion pathway protein B n=1 Tax=Geothermobacter ehrlichii TaxID=213224 RepID=A0A5D3WPY6_9BACT|nr:general secretion pathway protein GspB [Geothermobacter ehrlichii]TYP00287.1 general secretion pathway protein B [Geothermobacter ehrlichii]